MPARLRTEIFCGSCQLPESIRAESISLRVKFRVNVGPILCLAYLQNQGFVAESWNSRRNYGGKSRFKTVDKTSPGDRSMSKRVAYVTGGMGGIGTAICQRLAKDGFTVVAGCGPNSPRKDKWLADQSLKRALFTRRMRMRALRSPAATMRWTSSGKGLEISKSHVLSDLAKR